METKMVQSYSKWHLSNCKEDPRVAGADKKVSRLTQIEQVILKFYFKKSIFLLFLYFVSG